MKVEILFIFHAATLLAMHKFVDHLWACSPGLPLYLFPYIFYHLTHYRADAADIPVANGIPVRCADAIHCSARTPSQGSVSPLARQVLTLYRCS